MKRNNRMSKRGSNQKKRRSDKETDEIRDKGDASNDSPTVTLFKSFQIELDTRYDKHERLVKKSRDLTIESKRIIFLLHRLTSLGDNEEILDEAKKRLSTLYSTVIHDIAVELSKREIYQYIRAFTAGLQEFIEALSFYHYLRNGNVMSLDEVYDTDFLTKDSEQLAEKSALPFSELLTPMEYILGIADLTGELMRKCINSVGIGNFEEPFKLSLLLQEVYQALLVCGNHSRDLNRKLTTLRSSVQKVENACYCIKIRGTETPKHMLADLFSTEDPEVIDI